MVGQIPNLQFHAQLRFIIECRLRAEHGIGKIRKRLLIRKYSIYSRIEICEETLKIDNRRAAIDAIGNAFDLNLAGMASRARHPDFLAAAPAANGKANR